MSRTITLWILNPLSFAVVFTYLYSTTLTPRYRQPYQTLGVMLAMLAGIVACVPIYDYFLLKFAVNFVIELIGLHLFFRDRIRVKLLMHAVKWLVLAVGESFFIVIAVGVLRRGGFALM